LVVPLSLVVALSLSTRPALAQPFPYPERLPEGTTAIERMRSGTMEFADDPKKYTDQFQRLARYLAHRVVHPPYNGMEGPKKGGLPENIETLMEEAEHFLSWPNRLTVPNPNQIDYAVNFGKALEYEVMEVYEKAEKRLEKVNAARMLSLIGKMPYEGIADTYVKIIREDKYPLEIKLFAFEGLRYLLAIPDPLFPNRHFFWHAAKNAAKGAEIAKALEMFITRKYAAGLPAEDARVIQYVRREAVRALAQIKYSVIRQGAAVVLDKPIWTLLRVASNDKIVKPADAAMPGHGFSMPERIEAVVGILSMAPDPEVNLDVVAYLVNDALIEIGTFHNKERTDFQLDPRNRPLVPWRITGVHLADALKQWKTVTSTSTSRLRGAAEAGKFVDKALELRCIPKLEDRGVEAQADFRAFDDWKRDHKPKATQVIEADDTTTVDLGK
jgi:hypothetical protein